MCRGPPDRRPGAGLLRGHPHVPGPAPRAVPRPPPVHVPAPPLPLPPVCDPRGRRGAVPVARAWGWWRGWAGGGERGRTPQPRGPGLGERGVSPVGPGGAGVSSGHGGSGAGCGASTGPSRGGHHQCRARVGGRGGTLSGPCRRAPLHTPGVPSKPQGAQQRPAWTVSWGKGQGQ